MPTSKTSIFSISIGIALTLSSLILAPSALAYQSSCAAARACLYDNANYGGWLGQRAAGNPLENISTANNDRMSSWANKTSSNGAWYEHRDGGGFCRSMWRYSEANVDWGVNDRASSWRVNGAC